MATWVGEKIELYEGELLVFKRANSPMWYLRIYVAKEKKYYQKSCKTKSKFNAIDFANAGFFYSHPRMQGLQVAVIFWII